MQEKIGIDPEHLRLAYLGKPMRDENTLADYALRDGASVFLLLRVPGGSSGQDTVKRVVPSSLPRSDESCLITGESFKDDGLIVLKMPCGHPMSQDGLMDYAWNTVSSGKKTEIKCPLCPTIWSFDIITRYGGGTPAELEQLELGISRNCFDKDSDINQCPRCQTYCIRNDTSNPAVKCLICSKTSSFHFCWFCLKEWKGPFSSSCGNDSCGDSEKLAQLRNCGKTKVEYINIDIFKVRACPSCGVIIELAGGCKHMQCEMCKVEFCFVCLQKRSNGSWQCGSHNTKCDPAPLQTVIPRR